MYTLRKWYLNFKKQKILILMFHTKGITTFKSQQIYKNNCSFKRAMKELHSKKLILMRRNGKRNEYILTNKGGYLGMILNELSN